MKQLCCTPKDTRKKSLKTNLVIVGIERKQLRFCSNFRNKTSCPVNDKSCLLPTVIDVNMHPGYMDPTLGNRSLLISDTWCSGKSEDSLSTPTDSGLAVSRQVEWLSTPADCGLSLLFTKCQVWGWEVMGGCEVAARVRLLEDYLKWVLGPGCPWGMGAGFAELVFSKVGSLEPWSSDML